MIVAEKPPLTEDLLVHYGIPGMKWGRRKPPDPLIGRPAGYGDGRPETPAFWNGRKGSVGTANHKTPKSVTGSSKKSSSKKEGSFYSRHRTGTKVAAGIAGAAAAAYFLSKTGTRPSARAMTSGSNRIGRKAVVGVLKTYGKVGAKTLRAAPKVAGTTAKAGFKTSKFAGKTGLKVTKSVGRASSRSAQQAWQNIRNTPTAKVSPIRGQRLGNALLGNYGKQPTSALTNLATSGPDEALRRLYARARRR